MRRLAKPLTLFFGAALVSMLVGIGTPACSTINGGDACDGCEPGQDAYICNVPSSNNTVCAYDYAQAVGLCDPEEVVGMEECDKSTGGEANYPNWDPDSYVYHDRSTGEYVVDPQLISDIADDGAVLFLADQGKLMHETGGYYKFYNIGADDLARHLGFQSGDKIISVNGRYVLQDWPDYAEAIVDLRYATSFAIVVERGGSYTTLYYRVQ